MKSSCVLAISLTNAMNVVLMSNRHIHFKVFTKLIDGRLYHFAFDQQISLFPHLAVP